MFLRVIPLIGKTDISNLLLAAESVSGAGKINFSALVTVSDKSQTPRLTTKAWLCIARMKVRMKITLNVLFMFVENVSYFLCSYFIKDVFQNQVHPKEW